MEDDTFQVVFIGDAPVYGIGSFAIITNLGDGLSWDTSSLQFGGVLTVVPELGTWAMAGVGLGAIFFLRACLKTLSREDLI